MKKGIVYTTISLIVFLSLIFYNYLNAQRAISEERASITKVETTSFPKITEAGSRAAFSWHVEVPEGLRTSATTLYWGYESSPSALLDFDSPQAVGYPNHPEDYESGEFPLPSDFSVTIVPDKPGRVFFRSYAFVQGKHLWSDEQSVIISSKPNGQ
ncbi:MAG: hypothetical protein UX12_C0024G0001 [Candidatus Collierbacteria bacterium GW2011_GWC1_45_47]|uniref:Uncharacterized protein n=4 Tax=Candidatus Collieribacteriota TaxID=1752725 RepID=A0A0G1JPS5_9BACT|nr:MAG: hypothetical protein UW23_C0019G0010 [Candidatus Collierbacteria bacterium GW2011_GWA1_44_12]KKT45967.1 MAG: hypothetical protein UW35_C0026G0002 [Candidatus Collierbacteria bacterium GW2011_GWF2_44_15]KKT98463.1 MAG: hypothetical protein UW99_C0023G0001 [Candidatus Collierbacteria bacterium GW2011_GWC2_45_15]KKU09041.1 MAG: hypothetical protein UX12_C0024G0001 [Candidatus Collierbacteria bacterium GW2011_GWC1_45_47]KKU28829.1 MAG: hypothetical protein UX41_C0026G0004 [Candidatus Collie